MNCVRYRIKMIDNFETWFFSEVVDARDIDQVIEQEFVPAEFRDLTKIVCCNRASRFTVKFSLALNLGPKRFAHGLEQFLGSHALRCCRVNAPPHANASSSFSASSGF